MSNVAREHKYPVTFTAFAVISQIESTVKCQGIHDLLFCHLLLIMFVYILNELRISFNNWKKKLGCAIPKENTYNLWAVSGFRGFTTLYLDLEHNYFLYLDLTTKTRNP